MNFLMNLIQLGLDVGILALCCEAVFRQKSEIKAKDFFIFPILLVLCVVPRVDFSVGANMTASFRSEGFEILPADNIVGLLLYSAVSILGATVDLGLLWSVADTFNGLMSIPNLIALLLLSGTVVGLTKEYFASKD